MLIGTLRAPVDLSINSSAGRRFSISSFSEKKKLEN